MGKRFKSALLISEGAVNPSGIAHALVAACKECLDEGVQQRTDPAVRLIVHQLAYIMKDSELSDSLILYSELSDKCKKEAEKYVEASKVSG